MGKGSMRPLTRLIIGVIVGVIITSLPWLARNHEALSPISSILLMPGAIVAILLSGGSIHDYSETILLTANAGFYAWITYLFLRPRRQKISN